MPSARKARATMRATVVLPVPGLPVKTMWYVIGGTLSPWARRASFTFARLTMRLTSSFTPSRPTRESSSARTSSTVSFGAADSPPPFACTGASTDSCPSAGSSESDGMSSGKYAARARQAKAPAGPRQMRCQRGVASENRKWRTTAIGRASMIIYRRKLAPELMSRTAKATKNTTTSRRHPAPQYPHFAELLSMNDILPYFAAREYGIIPHHEGLL